ncbi:MAG: hypothetical protein JRN44_03375 [Nitrososphaerota archaeon]|nr:hypothetical protein [Nitrososphaerota archaeon]MDG6947547.1 hypothetical protein [Nitrososphaerota archaeon]
MSVFDEQSALDSIESEKRSRLGVGGGGVAIGAMMSRTGLRETVTHDEALKGVYWIEPVDTAARGKARRVRGAADWST